MKAGECESDPKVYSLGLLCGRVWAEYAPGFIGWAKSQNGKTFMVQYSLDSGPCQAGWAEGMLQVETTSWTIGVFGLRNVRSGWLIGKVYANGIVNFQPQDGVQVDHGEFQAYTYAALCELTDVSGYLRRELNGRLGVLDDFPDGVSPETIEQVAGEFVTAYGDISRRLLDDHGDSQMIRAIDSYPGSMRGLKQKLEEKPAKDSLTPDIVRQVITRLIRPGEEK